MSAKRGPCCWQNQARNVNWGHSEVPVFARTGLPDGRWVLRLDVVNYMACIVLFFFRQVNDMSNGGEN